MNYLDKFGQFDTAWCPGCGNFSISNSVKKALILAGKEPHNVLFVSGIGQAAKAPHYIKANVFNGLHGRAIPPAQGAKLANTDLCVIVESGEGCTYGEGGNHFLAAIRRNVDITVLVHNNQIYGLTKGQASPTSDLGMVVKSQPNGVLAEPFNPVAVAVAMKASFVARGFSGNEAQLADIIKQAIEHKGFSLVDILQPCVSFNKINNFAWYKKRCYSLSNDYDPMNWEDALKKSFEWGEKIPTGIIFKNNKLTYEDGNPVLNNKVLINNKFDNNSFVKILNKYL